MSSAASKKQTRRHYTDDFKKKIVNELEGGAAGVDAIAEREGIHHTVIRAWVRKLQVKKARHVTQAKPEETETEKALSGYTLEFKERMIAGMEAAKQTGVPGAITEFLKREGVRGTLVYYWRKLQQEGRLAETRAGLGRPPGATRTHTEEYKRRIVAETEAAKASGIRGAVKAICAREKVNAGLVGIWRRKYSEEPNKLAYANRALAALPSGNDLSGALAKRRKQMQTDVARAVRALEDSLSAGGDDTELQVLALDREAGVIKIRYTQTVTLSLTGRHQ